MGAVKEALSSAIDSVFETQTVEMNGDQVLIAQEMMETFISLLNGDNQAMHQKEHQWFDEYSIDTADFLSDWTHCITAAVAIYTGIATTEDGLIGNSFAFMAYWYHIQPRRCAVAMMKAGLNDKAIQAILYLLAGVILDENDKLKIVKFDYLNR
jgi:hypothetical protein